MSFASLKTQGSLLQKLNQELKKEEGSTGYIDDRIWKPAMGKDGVGNALIRFLPPAEGNDMPWAKVYSHAFQGPTGSWYIENSLTTVGQQDPVSELNRVLWNSGLDSDKEVARKQKRKLSYYSNIYVVKDPAHPENEGKVFLFKFGKKIFDKILNAMQPEFEDEEPINPFDFWSGANFRLKIRKVEGYWNYDKSEFDRSSALLDDDDALESLWKKEYSLSAIVAPDQFKSYEDLEKRLNYVLGKKPNRVAVQEQEDDLRSYETTPSHEESVIEELEASYRKSKEVPDNLRQELSNLPSSNTEDEDDSLQYFQRLIDG